MKSFNPSRTPQRLAWILMVASMAAAATAAEAPVELGLTETYVALAGTTLTNVASVGTVIYGDIGVSPGTAITGFPPGVVVGTINAGNFAAAQAQADLSIAYDDAAGRTTAPVTVSGNLGGMTLYPGLYKSTSSLEITSGDLTLDAQGDPNAVFIFQMASTLTTTSGRQVILAGGAQPDNIFWQVGSSATFGSTSIFKGNVLAQVSITLNTGATLDGRALARTGHVSLDGNAMVKPAPVECSTFFFPSSSEGWIGHTHPSFTWPILAHNPTPPGSIDITATDNINNFGYWESPPFELVVAPGKSAVGSIPLAVSSLEGGEVFALTFNLVGDALEQDIVPEIRLRTTAENSQQADLAVISSNSAGGISPYLGNPSSATLYFMPPAGSPDFRLQLDMLNFAQLGDSPNATVGLNSVSVCEFDPVDVSDAVTEAHFTFNESDEGWGTQDSIAYQAPNFAYDAEGGRLNITSVDGGTDFQFGYWASAEVEPMVHPVDGRLYFAEFTVESDQTDATIVPSFRVRINESGFRVAQYMQVASTGTALNSPTLGNPKTYTVFFPPNVATDGAYLTYAFDIVTQETDNDAIIATLSLTELVVKSVPLR